MWWWSVAVLRFMSASAWKNVESISFIELKKRLHSRVYSLQLLSLLPVTVAPPREELGIGSIRHTLLRKVGCGDPGDGASHSLDSSGASQSPLALCVLLLTELKPSKDGRRDDQTTHWQDRKEEKYNKDDALLLLPLVGHKSRHLQ